MKEIVFWFIRIFHINIYPKIGNLTLSGQLGFVVSFHSAMKVNMLGRLQLPQRLASAAQVHTDNSNGPQLCLVLQLRKANLQSHMTMFYFSFIQNLIEFSCLYSAAPPQKVFEIHRKQTPPPKYQLVYFSLPSYH